MVVLQWSQAMHGFKTWLIFIYCLGMLFLGLTSLAAQTEQVEVQLPSETIRANQRFTLTLRISDYGISVPQAVLPDLGAAFTLVAGPEISAGEGIDRQGRRSNYRFMRFVLRANQAGHFVVPSFVVTFASQVINVPATLVEVASQDDASWVPPRLEWTISENTVYEGQAVLVSLRLRFVSKIEFPQGLEFVKPQEFMMVEVSGLDAITSETVAANNFNVVPVASWLISPTRPGAFALPEAKLKLGTRTVAVRARAFIVQALPPGLETTGAIGKLEFKVLFDQSKAAINQAFVFTIRVEGDGNLALLRIPEPDFGTLTVLGSGENKRFVPSAKGYKGFRERSWSLSSPIAGFASVYVPALPVLTSTGSLRPNPATVASIQVLSSQSASLGSGRNVPQTIDTSTIHEPFFRLDRFPANLIIQVPVGLFLAGILVLRLARPKRRRTIVIPSIILVILATLTSILVIVLSTIDSLSPEDHRQLKQAQSLADTGNFERAQEILHALTVTYPRNADLHYQTGVAAARNYSPALSIFYLDKALRLQSESQQFGDYKQVIEAGLSLERQIPLMITIPAPVLTISSIVLLSLISLAFLLKRRGKKAGFWVFVMLCAMLWMVNAGLLFMQLQQKNSQVAVLWEPGGFLRKIPEASSTAWLQLAGGTSVTVLARSDDFLLIETAYGIRGWIDRTALYTWDRLVLETRTP